MAEETQDGQKTLVSFVVGLLIGGMLVWAFSGPSADAPVAPMGADDSAETDAADETDADEASDDEDSASNSEGDTEDTADKGGESAPAAPAPALEVGDGAISVSDQPAGSAVAIDSAVYPISEGWVGVRSYNNDQLGSILGVVRFSESQGLVPEDIVLVAPTTPGNRYAVVVYTEDGDRDFNLAGDVQIDEIFDTFVAQ